MITTETSIHQRANETSAIHFRLNKTDNLL